MPQIYEVISPEFTYVEAVCDDVSGPTYCERDYCLTQAQNKREAKIKAVRHFRKTRAGYLDGAENPFSGLKVNPISEWRAADVQQAKADAEKLNYWAG